MWLHQQIIPWSIKCWLIIILPPLFFSKILMFFHMHISFGWLFLRKHSCSITLFFLRKKHFLKVKFVIIVSFFCLVSRLISLILTFLLTCLFLLASLQNCGPVVTWIMLESKMPFTDRRKGKDHFTGSIRSWYLDWSLWLFF